MRIDQENIEITIWNYLNDELSEDDNLLVLDWIQLSDQNKKEFDQIKSIYDSSKIKKYTVDVEKALYEVRQNFKTPEQKSHLFDYLQKIAAILFLPLLVSGILYFMFHQKLEVTDQITYNEVSGTPGTHSIITLSDGTKVWLNSTSTIKYPVKFQKNRDIFLEGEAFFQVKSDKNNPFIVHTTRFDVKATGTKFNVTAFKNDASQAVTLEDGVVDVNRLNSTGKAIASARLLPNQQALISQETKSLSVTDVDIDRYISWKEGKLIFKNDQMAVVINTINRFYNVDIQIKDPVVRGYMYRATFDNESLNDILNLIKMTSPVVITESKRVKNPDGTFSKRQIVITSKK
ncbi:MAG: FecR domain-containing protein [Bacteroidetes bacterium]|nr:FecR domain-containing protein [Bacteroidota bacterium]